MILPWFLSVKRRNYFIPTKKWFTALLLFINDSFYVTTGQEKCQKRFRETRERKLLKAKLIFWHWIIILGTRDSFVKYLRGLIIVCPKKTKFHPKLSDKSRLYFRWGNRNCIMIPRELPGGEVQVQIGSGCPWTRTRHHFPSTPYPKTAARMIYISDTRCA